MKSYSVAGVGAAIFIALLPFVKLQELFHSAINSKLFFVGGAVTVAILYASYCILIGRHTIPLRRRWLALSVLVFLAFLYISSFLGVYPGGSLLSDILRSTGVFFLTYVAFLAFFLSETLLDRDWSLLRRTIAFSGALFALLTLMGEQGLGLTGRFLSINLETPGLSIGNTTFAGAYLVLTFVITLIEFWRAKEGSNLRKFLGAALLAHLISPLILLNGIWSPITSNVRDLIGEARASSVTILLVAVFIEGWWLIRTYVATHIQKRATMLWNSLWMIAVFAAVVLLFVPQSFVQKQYIEESTAARVLVWNEGFRAFSERPILGWGPENFRFAHDRHFDNRLFLDENLGEVWFDRAHNIVVDTLVSVGIVGFAASVALAVLFVVIVVRARKRGLISEVEMTLLGVLPVAHFLQLQTSFDTVVTYTMMGVVFGYVLWLERQMIPEDLGGANGPWAQKTIAALLIVATVVGGWYVLINQFSRQKALFELFVVGDREEQVELIGKALSNTTSSKSLRFASASFIQGSLEALENPQLVPEDRRPEFIATVQQQMKVYDKHYIDFLERAPEDYRTRMNYAYLLLFQIAFGEPRYEDAQKLIDDSYQMSPGNPLTYALDAINQFYAGDVGGAKERIREGIALNPEAPFTLSVLDYIEEQERNLPRVGVLRFENL